MKEYNLNEEVFTITVTLYETPKDNQPKLHIQSSSQCANNEYTLKELPSLYADVRKTTPSEMIRVIPGDGAETSDPAKMKKPRGRPSKQSAKSIRTVKDLVKYCKVQSCKFTTKVTRDMSAHNKIHQRDEIFDLHRNFELEESVSEMDCVISENGTDPPAQASASVPAHTPALAPAPAVSVGDSSTAFDFGIPIQARLIQCQEEIKKSQTKLGEKDNLIEELKNKVKELENDAEKMRKKFIKEEKHWELDLGEMKVELNRAMDKASSFCEENTILKEKVKTLENREIANFEIQQKYERLINVVKVSTGCQTEDQNDDENIEVLVRHKKSGFRRTDPLSPPSGPQQNVSINTETDEEHQCNMCGFKTNSQGVLKKHISNKHHKCDLCDRVLKTPVLLRSHLREIHDKKHGTMFECNKCYFSALNQVHLNMHINRHHTELSCNQCDYKTETRPNLMEHTAQNHRRSRNPTCKYWLQNNCKRTNCQYKHEKVMCRFGNNCNKRNCQYDHEKPMYTESRQPNISPWTNPAFLGGAASVESFPFLERSCQCQGQNRRRGM